MAINKLDFQITARYARDMHAEFLNACQDKINELVDAVSALQDYCMARFPKEGSEDPTIKNCGFCGSDAEFINFGDYDVPEWQVVCTNEICPNYFRYKNKIDASRAWNTHKGENND